MPLEGISFAERRNAVALPNLIDRKKIPLTTTIESVAWISRIRSSYHAGCPRRQADVCPLEDSVDGEHTAILVGADKNCSRYQRSAEFRAR
jgi:hypothetical protein